MSTRRAVSAGFAAPAQRRRTGATPRRYRHPNVRDSTYTTGARTVARKYARSGAAISPVTHAKEVPAATGG
jgi:hypothetical protein